MAANADANSDQIRKLQSQIQALQNDVSQMTSGMASHAGSDSGLAMHGFMDVGYSNNTAADPVNHPRGFNVGALSFYLTPQFGDSVKALVEPNIEVGSDGGISLDLERIQIGYTFSDAATLWAGRFHTPYGYWNTAFHHGAQMQTSVVRPRFLAFEDQGGILPAHMVGLWSVGKIRTGDGKLTYDLFAGNGPKIVMGGSAGTQTLGTQDMQMAGDNNHQAMAGINLGYEFSGAMDGLRFAVHALRGDVADDSDGTAFAGANSKNNTDLYTYGGSMVYLENDWELMTELYKFRNNDKSGITGIHRSSASYLQIGHAFGSYIPYFRKELAILDQTDNFFNMQESGQSYKRYVAGLRYDIDPKACVKLEAHYSDFAKELNRTAAKYHSYYLQYAVRF